MSETELNKLEETELDDLLLDDNQIIVYQVNIVGLGEYSDYTDYKYSIGEFDDTIEAEKCFKFFANSKEDIQKLKIVDDSFYIPANVYSIELTVDEIVRTIDKSTNQSVDEFNDVVFDTKIKIK